MFNSRKKENSKLQKTAKGLQEKGKKRELGREEEQKEREREGWGKERQSSKPRCGTSALSSLTLHCLAEDGKV